MKKKIDFDLYGYIYNKLNELKLLEYCHNPDTNCEGCPFVLEDDGCLLNDIYRGCMAIEKKINDVIDKNNIKKEVNKNMFEKVNPRHPTMKIKRKIIKYCAKNNINVEDVK